MFCLSLNDTHRALKIMETRNFLLSALAGGVILTAWLRKIRRRKCIARDKAFVTIVKLQQSDRADWERLWRG